jgi:hypothetical protein
VRTAQGVPPRALGIPWPVGHRCKDLDRALEDPLDLGQGLLNQAFQLGKRLRRLHPVIPHALEAFGKDMLHHTPDEGINLHRFPFHPLAPMGAIVIGDPLPIVAVDTP